MTTIKANSGATTVEAADGLKTAIEAAHVRAAQVHIPGHKTLIDQIPIEAWESWDASDEKALVADSGGLAGDDPLDGEHPFGVAA